MNAERQNFKKNFKKNKNIHKKEEFRTQNFMNIENISFSILSCFKRKAQTKKLEEVLTVLYGFLLCDLIEVILMDLPVLFSALSYKLMFEKGFKSCIYLFL